MENEVAKQIVDAALKVHRILGPGLLESVYEMVLSHELRQRGLTAQTQVPIALRYEGLCHPDAFRLDVLVEDCVIVELKSVEAITMLHKKQLLTYLRLADKRLGLLINFGAPLLRDGLHRIANNL